MEQEKLLKYFNDWQIGNITWQIKVAILRKDLQIKFGWDTSGRMEIIGI